jgi:inhibitor of KinA
MLPTISPKDSPLCLAISSAEILETVPAYCSLAVYLKPHRLPEKILPKLEAALKDSGVEQKTETARLYHIPVCYGGNFGPDLKEVCALHRLSSEKVIALHTRPVYMVFFLGFLPGFPYLSGLSEELYTPRKQTPRQQVEKGAVGIGGGQTGIYTVDSPGGWNIIGRSPLSFFNPANPEPALFSSGDRIKFFAVSEEEYARIASEVSNGNYKIKKEVYHD